MENEPNRDNSNKSENSKLSAVALPLAFMPSVLVLSVFAFPFAQKWPGVLFAIQAGISFLCCLVSTSLLGRHNTPLWTAITILFFILNAVISGFFGFTAYVVGVKL